MKNWNRRVFHIGSRTIDVVQASIVDIGAHIDAIVSSDDNLLSHGGGISKAIWHAAGRGLARYVEEAKPPLRLGDVFVSPPGHLLARVVLHAVTIDFDANRRIGPAELPQLYTRVLNTAEQHECQSIALPILAAGAAGLTQAESTQGLVHALRVWLSGPTGLNRVVVPCIGGSYELALTAVGDNLADLPPIEWLVDRAAGCDRFDARQLPALWVQLTAVAFEDRYLAGRLLLAHSIGAVLTSWDVCRGHEWAEAFRGPALDRLATAWRSAAQEAGKPLLADVDARLSAAVLLPDSTPTASEAESLGLLLLAVRDALTAVTVDQEPPRPVPLPDALPPPLAAEFELSDGTEPGSFRPAEHSLHAAQLGNVRQLTRLRGQRATPEPLGAAGLDYATRADGTSHVRRLHEFLLRHLDPHDLASLYRELESYNYRGEPGLRLLEHLVATDHPDSIIVDHFTKGRLMDAVEKTTGRRPNRRHDEGRIARDLLADLGFPMGSQPRGLAAAISQAQSLKPMVVIGSEQEVRGAVAQVARDLEYLCRVLLRFVCSAGYNLSPEQLFRESGDMKVGDSLTTLGLGRLLDLLGHLAKRLADDGTPRAQLLREQLQGRELLPDAARTARLAEIRNKFVHFKSSDPHLGLEDLRRRASRFLDDALGFLNYLGADEARLFPRVVLVEEIIMDRWGRRKVRVTDDEGRHEVLFTSKDLEPGGTYLMHPLTNVLRVDPILVAAGDLGRLDAPGGPSDFDA